MKGCIVEFKKTQNRYMILGETQIKDKKSRNWLNGIIYQEYEEFINGEYKTKKGKLKTFSREETEFWRKFKLVDPEKPKAYMFYGMSGSLKGTTVEALSKNYQNLVIMNSTIKEWKAVEQGPLEGEVFPSSLNYANLFLNRLGDFTKTKKNLLIERGVSDMLFYHELFIGGSDNLIYKKFRDIIDMENNILKNYDVKRILLIQKDSRIINEFVLNNGLRNSLCNKTPWFTDLDSYLKAQEDYVKFTKHHNEFFEIVEITDADDFCNKLNNY